MLLSHCHFSRLTKSRFSFRSWNSRIALSISELKMPVARGGGGRGTTSAGGTETFWKSQQLTVESIVLIKNPFNHLVFMIILKIFDTALCGTVMFGLTSIWLELDYFPPNHQVLWFLPHCPGAELHTQCAFDPHACQENVKKNNGRC